MTSDANLTSPRHLTVVDNTSFFVSRAALVLSRVANGNCSPQFVGFDRNCYKNSNSVELADVVNVINADGNCVINFMEFIHLAVSKARNRSTMRPSRCSTGTGTGQSTRRS